MPDWQPLQSSNIAACAYEPDSRTLHIRFNSGRSYAYADVPQDVYDGLMSATSPGQFVNNAIKGVYSVT